MDITKDKEFSIFSQYGEDGIIEAIFAQLPAAEGTRKYVEIGWHPDENNTTYLRFEKDWEGIAIDQEQHITKQHFYKRRITADNILEVLADLHIPYRPDLLSLDIDGQDYWVLDQIIRCYQPKVIVCEYNAAFGAERSVTVPLDNEWTWDGTNFFGASLAAFGNLLNNLANYSLVYANGCNAFFVAEERFQDHKPLDVAGVFKPACYPAHPQTANLFDKVVEV